MSPLHSIALLSLLPLVSPMFLVPRTSWNATPPTEPYKPMPQPNLGTKIHYVGPVYTTRPHAHCSAYMKSIQEDHLANPEQGWMDIAYNLAVCEHGYVFDGRGAGHMSGANGNSTLNENHYAVLAFLGKVGLMEPTGEQVEGVKDAVAYLRRAGAGREIRGHRDGWNTECPGENLYKLVTGGGLEPGKLWDGGEHVVKHGETVECIAEEYNVPARYIVAVNGLKGVEDVKAGDVLEIPARGVPIDPSLFPPEEGDGDGDGGELNYEEFPGADFFKSEPNSPIIKSMGERLVEIGCGKYSDGPSTQWTDEDLASYACWQEALGYTGADADGWPGKVSWDQLQVPAVE